MSVLFKNNKGYYFLLFPGVKSLVDWAWLFLLSSSSSSFFSASSSFFSYFFSWDRVSKNSLDWPLTHCVSQGGLEPPAILPPLLLGGWTCKHRASTPPYKVCLWYCWRLVSRVWNQRKLELGIRNPVPSFQNHPKQASNTNAWTHTQAHSVLSGWPKGLAKD